MPAPLLTYQQRPRLLWVSRWRRWLIAGAILGSLGPMAMRFAPRLVMQAEWMYWSRKCAAYVMPQKTDVVVFDPIRVKPLVINPDYVVRGQGAIFCPRVWRKLKLLDGRYDCIRDDMLGLIFLGTRNRPDGAARFIAMSGSYQNGYCILNGATALVIPQPALFDNAPPAVFSWLLRWNGPALGIVMHAGVADKNDPAHFVINFDVPSQYQRPSSTGTIDAYLQNDDSIRFTLRQSPLLDPQAALGYGIRATRMR